MGSMYDLDATPEQWFRGVLQVGRELIAGELGLMGYEYEVRAPDAVEMRGFDAAGTPPQVIEELQALSGEVDEERIALTYGANFHVVSLSSLAPAHSELDHIDQDWQMQQMNRITPVRDTVMARIEGLGEGPRFMMVAPRREIVSISRAVERSWAQFAAHAAAGWRLRQAVGAQDAAMERSSAILTPDGGVEYVQGDAKPGRLERLRRAAQLVATARRRFDDGDLRGGIDLWQGLFEGRYSVVDHFDTDGRHFVLLLENAPVVDGPLSLTERERQIAQAAARDHDIKLIAYELGVAHSTARVHLASALAKLGLERREQLQQLGNAVLGRSAHLGPLNAGEATMYVAATDDVATHLPDALTDAEREVAELIFEGRSNAEIAEQRGVAVRTVANQVASILKKCACGSRGELVVRLGGR